jgi:hypothetical protein
MSVAHLGNVLRRLLSRSDVILQANQEEHSVPATRNCVLHRKPRSSPVRINRSCAYSRCHVACIAGSPWPIMAAIPPIPRAIMPGASFFTFVGGQVSLIVGARASIQRLALVSKGLHIILLTLSPLRLCLPGGTIESHCHLLGGFYTDRRRIPVGPSRSSSAPWCIYQHNHDKPEWLPGL